MSEWASLIRDVPDFPEPGILFKDVTPLLADAEGFAACLHDMAAPWRDGGIEAVCGIESRGFIFGAALAPMLGVGFVPLRKAGKLPADTVGVDYALEYGHARLEIHRDALTPGQRVLIVDDVLATGGTLAASRELVEQTGAKVAGAAVVLELAFLDGRSRWIDGVPLESLVCY
ncbi:MAG TPA: adenine phosphoribosyltransferase [Rhodanobacteraceae bacterium]|nr:adenine phosphoribosyltransferase [Rhodanobacteraceae bacterium]